MPVIALASPKGGVGKTTAAVVLAGELAEKGADVVLIDADPNQPISTWAALPGKPARLQVITDQTEDTIIDTIEDAARRAPFVLVDLEGTASMMVSYAVSRADLVLIPVQGSQLDAAQAVRAVKLIRQTEKAFGASIDHAVLFTRTNPALQPRTLRHIEEQFRRHGLSILGATMVEREAFRAIFSFGGTVRSLQPGNASNLAAARDNATALAREVAIRLSTRLAAA